jgi:ABC-type multidrug transport system fused ATPase/permease subunit/GT2 family glycosyltransferase
LDFVCFNVYLETRERLQAYLRRLQNLAGEKPLVMAEIGLDSRRNGLERQAEVLEWQVREVFAEGCTGAFIFAWTDEWYRGGYDIEDWDFGLIDRDRRPKPALAAVTRAFAHVPFPATQDWPRISVVVCSYNGARTIRDTLEALQLIEYPDFEVILVDDGSKDATAAIGREFGARVISTENRGLSNARNTGYEAATGELVAYIDDDAYPDPHWLLYLAHRFTQGGWEAVGGPNLAPRGDGMIAECVANSPGGPVHVLVSDIEAEHIPGCNMAFRKSALEAIGGFDPRFRTAGDDVDVCWRLVESGGRIGFHAGALVWHHRRNSVRTYWRQQRGYGRAEALLERKWPEKYNAPGHLSWIGRLYGRGLTAAVRRAAGRVYQGHAGTALFQSVYQPAPGLLASLSLMPEWHLAVLALAGITALGVIWTPLFLAAPLLVIALTVPLGQAAMNAARATFPRRRGISVLCRRLLTCMLHATQPVARLFGRIQYGLTPWRRRGRGLALPLPRSQSAWREEWESPEARTQTLAAWLKRQEAAWSPGGDFDPWDFEVRGGLLSSARLLSTVEEHGWGRQLVRFRVWPRISAFALFAIGALGALALATAIAGAWPAAGALGLIAGLTAVRAIWEAGLAMGAANSAIRKYRKAAKMKLIPRGGDIGLLVRVMLLARPYWLLIFVFFLVSMLATPLTLLTPIPLKIVADALVGRQAIPGTFSPLVPDALESSETQLILLAAVLFVLVALLRQVQELARMLLYTYIGELLTLKFRSKLFGQVQRISLAYHDTQGTADSVYRIQYDATSIQSLAIEGVIPFLSSSFTLVAMLYVILAIDWQLAIAALAATPVMLVLTRAYQTKLRQRARSVKRLESSAMEVIQEVLGSLRVVKAFGQEDREQERFYGRAEDGVQSRVGLSAMEGVFGLLIGVTTAGVSAIVLYIGALHVRSGVLTLGELLLVMGYLSQLYDPLRNASRRIGKMQSSLASAERAFQLLDQAPDVPERPEAAPLPRAGGGIRFRDVSFGYNGHARVLSNVSFQLRPGQRLGVYGVTGAGKTTLISLLTRLYDPRAGAIFLDGIDIRDYKLADLRNQFAVVLQEPVLFSTTIAENIAYARPGASNEEVVQAAIAANAHDFIESLPDGYDTIVGERGMRLSGGERQRVALARAFLKDAPILVLDEPTSSVDHRTEEAIIASMERLMAGRTAIIIAHRLTTLDECDRWLELLPGGRTRVMNKPPSGARHDVEEPAASTLSTLPHAGVKADV